MARAKATTGPARPAIEIPEGSTADNFVPLCPFTLKPLELVPVSSGWWIGRGDFYSTKLFQTRRELLHMLCTRDGMFPLFDSHPQVQLKKPVVVDNDPVQDEIDKGTRLNDTVSEYVDRNKDALRLRK